MKKWYRIFILTISIIIGLSFATWMLNSTSVKVAFNSKVTQDDYTYLKECTLKVAKNTDAELENDNVRSYKTFDNENLYVTCELSELDIVKCKVHAQYPLIIDEGIVINKDNIQITGKIDFDNVVYQEEEIMKPLSSQIMAIILETFVIVALIYFLCYYTPKEIKGSLAWQQEQYEQKEQE